MNPGFSIQSKIKELYCIAHELEDVYKGRKFTPDGHMIGSIGEVLAADEYGLTLMKPSFPIHDAITSDGRMVQIKATQIKRIAISSQPDYLLVLHFNSDGTWEEIYNGPGNIPWTHVSKPSKTGQRYISLSLLTKLMSTVPEKEKISHR